MTRYPEGLQPTGKGWRLRVRVPRDLVSVLGKKEITRSLRTNDFEEARRRVRFERTKLDAEFAKLRRDLPAKPLTDLSDQDLWFMTAKLFVSWEKEHAGLDLSDYPVEQGLEEHSWLANREHAGTTISATIRSLLESENVVLPAGSPAWGKLERYVQAALVESQRRLIQSASPTTSLPANPLFSELTERSILHPVARMAVADLIGRYEADPGRSPPSSKSKLKRASEFRLIKDFFGAKTRISEIKRERCRAFMELLAKYPSNATKRFGELKPEEVIALAAEKGLEPMSTTTANAYLATVNRAFQFAVDEGWLRENPARKLRIQAKRSYQKNGRDPFSISDLNVIFKAPLYTGCKDDWQGYATPGPNVPRRGRFWVPLLSLFTGMRLNEACQLTCDDVVVMDGVDVILIRGADDETKRVKTEAGQRFVPVHPQLRQLGFLLHVADRREHDGTEARLFPELGLSVSGYLSDNFSKWFARFLDKVGISERRKAFHSFRHTYRDGLREADISIEKVRALGGWSSGNTEDQYGSGPRASTLARDIDRVRFTGLDLEHLWPTT